MRFVQVTIPPGKRKAILDILDDEGIDYVVTEETGGKRYTAIVSFPLPTGAVEPILERLREAGVERDAYTIVIDAETVVSRDFEALMDRYEADETYADRDRIAQDELRTRAAELVPTLWIYGLLTLISIVVATAGVLLDSAATVVGSMVIAPLIGPAMATSVGTVIDDEELFTEGLKYQIVGFTIGVVGAIGFALVVKTSGLVPPGLDPTSLGEVSERIAPDFLMLPIALGSGAAGAMSLRAGVSTALVGVMIAVALVPPVAVVGIGVAWGQPAVALGALILVAVNALSINLAAIGVFWYSGYKPDNWLHLPETRSTAIKRATVLVVAILVLSAALGATTYRSYYQASTTNEIESAVGAVLAATQEGTHIETIVAYNVTRIEEPLRPNPSRVVVTVGTAEGQPVPGLSSRIRDRLVTDLGSRVRGTVIELRFVTVEIADGDGRPSGRLPAASITSPPRPSVGPTASAR